MYMLWLAQAKKKKKKKCKLRHFYATISLKFSLEVIYAAILIAACWHEHSTVDAKTAQMSNPSQCAIGSDLLALFYTHH